MSDYQAWRDSLTALVTTWFELGRVYTHDEAMALLGFREDPHEDIRQAIYHKDLLLTSDWRVVRRY